MIAVFGMFFFTYDRWEPGGVRVVSSLRSCTAENSDALSLIVFWNKIGKTEYIA